MLFSQVSMLEVLLFTRSFNIFYAPRCTCSFFLYFSVTKTITWSNDIITVLYSYYSMYNLSFICEVCRGTREHYRFIETCCFPRCGLCWIRCSTFEGPGSSSLPWLLRTDSYEEQKRNHYGRDHSATG